MIWPEGCEFPTNSAMIQKNPLANTGKPRNNGFQGIKYTYLLFVNIFIYICHCHNGNWGIKKGSIQKCMIFSLFLGTLLWGSAVIRMYSNSSDWFSLNFSEMEQYKFGQASVGCFIEANQICYVEVCESWIPSQIINGTKKSACK